MLFAMLFAMFICWLAMFMSACMFGGGIGGGGGGKLFCMFIALMLKLSKELGSTKLQIGISLGAQLLLVNVDGS